MQARAMPALLVFALVGLSPLTSSIAASASSLEVRITPDVSAARRQRIAEATSEAHASFSAWFAPMDEEAIVLDVRRLATAGAMEDEAQAAAVVARHWWGGRVRFAEADRALADGLAWYLQSHVVEQLFDRRWQVKAYAVEGERYFGGFVPWEFRQLYRARESFGLGRDVYVSGRARRAGPAPLDPEVARVALGLGTLERLLGWPVLQRALRVVFLAADGKNLDRATFTRLTSDAVGQDLDWVLAIVFGESTALSYAVTGFRTMSADTCGGATCFQTTVDLDGRAEAPAGVPVRVAFADGQQVTTTWRIREGRTLSFESPAAATVAEVDPDRRLLLDPNTLDNRRTLAPATDVPVTKWTARWVVWLQNAMLTYAFLF